MPTSTYTPLANITLGSNATSVTFSSITQSYRDLVLVIQAAGTGSSRYGFEVFLNGDSNFANYSRVRMAYESGIYSDSSTAPAIPVFSPESGAFTINLMDYSASNKHKSIILSGNTVGATNSSYSHLGLTAGRWANTAAVTSIQITEAGGASSIATGSTFALYGIAG